MELYIKTDKRLGKDLRHLRKRLKFTQEVTAKCLEISQGGLSKMERGETMFIKYKNFKVMFPELVRGDS